MIIFYFFDLANIDININELPEVYESDIVYQFIKLNDLAIKITPELNKDLLLEILSNLLNLHRFLGCTEEETEKYLFSKMDYTLSMIKNSEF